MTALSPAAEAFNERLRSFVFFHLGSDARVRVEETSVSLHIAVTHERVESFEFLVERPRLERLLEDPGSLEEFLLGFLNTYRRS